MLINSYTAPDDSRMTQRLADLKSSVINRCLRSVSRSWIGVALGRRGVALGRRAAPAPAAAPRLAHEHRSAVSTRSAMSRSAIRSAANRRDGPARRRVAALAGSRRGRAVRVQRRAARWRERRRSILGGRRPDRALGSAAPARGRPSRARAPEAALASEIAGAAAPPHFARIRIETRWRANGWSEDIRARYGDAQDTARPREGRAMIARHRRGHRARRASDSAQSWSANARGCFLEVWPCRVSM